MKINTIKFLGLHTSKNIIDQGIIRKKLKLFF